MLFDQTVVSVALPAIQRDFDSSTAELQWTMGAYLLTLASLMAAVGRLADLYGPQAAVPARSGDRRCRLDRRRGGAR